MNTPGTTTSQSRKLFTIAPTLVVGLLLTAIAPPCSAYPWNTDCLPDLWVIERHRTGFGQTRAHILNGEDIYSAFLLNATTTLSETGTDHAFEFLLGDFNGDSMLDIYVIEKTGTRSGRTEVHVLNGADLFRSLLVFGAKTPIRETGDDAAWIFLAAGCEGGRLPGQQ